METIRLPVKIAGHRGHGVPLRQLVLTCAVTNPGSSGLLILDAWLRVETKEALGLAEGALFHMEHALARPPVIPAGEDGTGIITVPLGDRVLQELEKRRAGKDLELRISSRVVACEVRGEGDTLVVARPVTTALEDRRSGFLEYSIPQSEWVKVLTEMQWASIVLLELPSRDLRSDARLSGALKRLEDAHLCYGRGLWEESAVNCRKAFEAMVKDTTGEDTMGKAPEAFRVFIPDATKANLIDKLAKELGSYLQLARHETRPFVAFGPSDAALALHMTAALLAYLVAPAG